MIQQKKSFFKCQHNPFTQQCCKLNKQLDGKRQHAHHIAVFRVFSFYILRIMCQTQYIKNSHIKGLLFLKSQQWPTSFTSHKTLVSLLQILLYGVPMQSVFTVLVEVLFLFLHTRRITTLTIAWMFSICFSECTNGEALSLH